MPKSKVRKKKSNNTANKTISFQGAKVSEIIMDFAMPWLKQAVNVEQQKAVLAYAVLVWNLGSMEEDEREDLKNEFLHEIDNGENDVETVRKQMDVMIERRVKYYSSVKKVVVNYEIKERNGKLQLDVVSADSK